MREKRKYTLGELAELLEVELRGDPDCLIEGLATLGSAGPGRLSFLSNARYTAQLAGCRASAIIVTPELAEQCPASCLLSRTPYVTYARASQLFSTEPAHCAAELGAVHPSAVIHHSALIGAGVSIGANAVVEENAVIGEGSVIGAGCYIGRGTQVGEHCRLYANVTLYHGLEIGDRCTLHSAAVIGADGFGFAFDGERSVKIAQLGGVRIGCDVEVGAGSTIDRGAIEDTVVEQGVKIDNQVQVGHNCHIGEHTVICGCTAIAGSARIGRYCTIAGAVGIVGHIKIVDRVVVSAMSLVSQSIHQPGVYSSGTAMQESTEWKKNIVRFSQLNEMAKRLRELEKKLNQ